MNTRIVLSAVLAASLVFAPALISAQAPPSLNSQTPQAKIESLQAQVQALQAQVKKLQAQLRAKSPSGVISPFYEIPNYNSAPFQFPNIQSPTPPNVQTFSVPPYNLPSQRPQPYSNIPPCTITLIGQKPR